MSVGVRANRPSSRVRRGGARAASGRAAVTLLPRRQTAARPAARLQSLLGRLPPHEWRRRMVHMSPGLFPSLFIVFPHAEPLTWFVKGPILLVTLGLAIFSLLKARLFARCGETGWVCSVVSYALITLALLMAFPSQPELGLVVTIIIAFGDGSATLAGMLARGRKLPWNSAKSWIGMAAFLICSIPLATLVYWGEAHPGVSLPVALACVVPAAVAAALAESLPTRINDNIRVGVAAGLTILTTHAMFVGW
jgi:dolichol kinase